MDMERWRAEVMFITRSSQDNVAQFEQVLLEYGRRSLHSASWLLEAALNDLKRGKSTEEIKKWLADTV
jgi:hypothetical protein